MANLKDKLSLTLQREVNDYFQARGFTVLPVADRCLVRRPPSATVLRRFADVPTSDEAAHWIVINPTLRTARDTLRLIQEPEPAGRTRMNVPSEVAERLPEEWLAAPSRRNHPRHSRPIQTRSGRSRLRALLAGAGAETAATTAFLAAAPAAVGYAMLGVTVLTAGWAAAEWNRVRKPQPAPAPAAPRTVTLAGWFAHSADELTADCRSVCSLSDDIPAEMGRAEVQRSAELALLAGAGLLADAQQISALLDRYLEANPSPEPDVLNATAQRLSELDEAWRQTRTELAGVLDSVSRLAELTRGSVARNALLDGLSASRAAASETESAVAAEMLRMVTASMTSSTQALVELRSISAGIHALTAA